LLINDIIKYETDFKMLMGKKGIEIVAAKIDVNEVIADLNKAYADEWSILVSSSLGKWT